MTNDRRVCPKCGFTWWTKDNTTGVEKCERPDCGHEYGTPVNENGHKRFDEAMKGVL